MTSWFCSCFGSKSKENKPKARQRKSIKCKKPRDPLRPIYPQNVPEEAKSSSGKFSLFAINSLIPKTEIKISEITPNLNTQNVYKYSCPICFRYFSRTLV